MADGKMKQRLISPPPSPPPSRPVVAASAGPYVFRGKGGKEGGKERGVEVLRIADGQVEGRLTPPDKRSLRAMWATVKGEGGGRESWREGCDC